MIIQDANLVSNDVLSRTLEDNTNHNWMKVYMNVEPITMLMMGELVMIIPINVDSLDIDNVGVEDDGSNQFHVGSHAMLRNKHVVPQLVDSSTDDKILKRDRSSSGQWIIPSAIYQIALHMDDPE